MTTTADLTLTAAPLVSVGRDGGCLWAVVLDDAPSGNLVEFGAEARAAWRDAALALPRSLPLLWQAVDGVQRLVPKASCAATWNRPYTMGYAPRVLDKPSFGLSFLISMAAHVLDHPIPADIVASAAIDPMGGLHGVDDIETKVEVVAAGRLGGRMLVAPGSAEKARMAAAGRVQIVPVPTAGVALTEVFGSGLSTLLVSIDPARRSALVDSFWRLAMGGRSGAVDWGPVARAAADALEWNDLERDDTIRLGIVRAIALRHEYNSGSLSVPADWLESLPAPVRIDVIANLVQQSADTASPTPEEALALARGLPEIRESHVEQLRLWGALGRLKAVIGQAPEALAIQEACARAFFEALSDGDVSFPLTEWFRLSGVLEDRAAYERAEWFRRRVLARGGFGFDGNAFVDLAQAKAQVMLGLVGEETRSTSRALAESTRVPDHLRWSAVRWHLKVMDADGRWDEAEALEKQLVEAGNIREGSGRERLAGKMARVFAALVDLDRAEARAAHTAIENAAERLRTEEPGIVSNLTLAGLGKSLSRHYPY